MSVGTLPVVDRFWRLRLGRLVGFGLFVASLPLYVSFENRPVLDRWSYEYTALMLVAGGVWLLLLFGVRKSNVAADPIVTRARLFDGGVLLWGIAYLVNALADPAEAGRVAGLNLFGSTVPVAAILEWLALLLFVGAVIAATSNLSGIRQNAAVSCVAVASLAVLGEGAARVKAMLWPAPQGFPTYSNEMWHRHHVRFNSLGFRDAAPDPRPDRGVHRLLVVGDSFAYGTGIERIEDRFGTLLGRHLERGTSERWEVLNAGKRDTHTLDHLDALERMSAFDPDLVVLLYVFNDIDYLEKQPRTGLSESPPTTWSRLRPSRLLFRNFYLFQELYVRWRLVEHRLDQDVDDAPPDPGLYGDPDELTRHLADLATFVESARAAATAVLIVPFDNATATGKAVQERYRSFVARVRQRGLPVCGLDGAFEDREFDDLTVNRLDTHPNERAQALAAEAAADCVLNAWSRASSADSLPDANDDADTFTGYRPTRTRIPEEPHETDPQGDHARGR